MSRIIYVNSRKFFQQFYSFLIKFYHQLPYRRRIIITFCYHLCKKAHLYYLLIVFFLPANIQHHHIRHDNRDIKYPIDHYLVDFLIINDTYNLIKVDHLGTVYCILSNVYIDYYTQYRSLSNTFLSVTIVLSLKVIKIYYN